MCFELKEELEKMIFYHPLSWFCGINKFSKNERKLNYLNFFSSIALTTISFSFSSRALNINPWDILFKIRCLASSFLGTVLATKAFFWLKAPKASALTELLYLGSFFLAAATTSSSTRSSSSSSEEWSSFLFFFLLWSACLRLVNTRYKTLQCHVIQGLMLELFSLSA